MPTKTSAGFGRTSVEEKNVSDEINELAPERDPYEVILEPEDNPQYLSLLIRWSAVVVISAGAVCHLFVVVCEHIRMVIILSLHSLSLTRLPLPKKASHMIFMCLGRSQS
jgi:hypothetical protein